jgi:hypothetical protein
VDCSIPSCYGTLSNDSQVCSGRGKCIALDSCTCTDPYSGNNCEFPVDIHVSRDFLLALLVPIGAVLVIIPCGICCSLLYDVILTINNPNSDRSCPNKCIETWKFCELVISFMMMIALLSPAVILIWYLWIWFVGDATYGIGITVGFYLIGISAYCIGTCVCTYWCTIPCSGHSRFLWKGYITLDEFESYLEAIRQARPKISFTGRAYHIKYTDYRVERSHYVNGEYKYSTSHTVTEKEDVTSGSHGIGFDYSECKDGTGRLILPWNDPAPGLRFVRVILTPSVIFGDSATQMAHNELKDNFKRKHDLDQHFDLGENYDIPGFSSYVGVLIDPSN